MGLIGSDSNSKTKQNTRLTDQSIAVSDQGVAYQDHSVRRNVGNTKNNNSVKVGKGGSYQNTTVVNQGISPEELQDILTKSSSAQLSSVASLLQNAGGPQQPQADESAENAFKATVLEKLEERAAANIDAGTDAVQEGSTSNVKKWVLWAVGGVVLLAALKMFLKR
jgi:hypothetical protein